VKSLEDERHHLLEKLRQRACDPAFEDIDENIRLEFMKLQEEMERMKDHESKLEEDNKMLKVVNETLKNTVGVGGVRDLMQTMLTEMQDQNGAAFSRTLQQWQQSEDTPEISVLALDSADPLEKDEEVPSSSLGVHCAQELVRAEAQITELTDALNEYENKMQIISGSLGQLYQEHNAVLTEKEDEITRIKAEMERLQQINDDLEGKLEKEATVDELLNSSNAEIVKKIKEITNENFILTINEKMLARRFKSIQHELEMRDDFTTQVQKDYSEMEQVLKDRICVLENGLKLQRGHYDILNAQFKCSVAREKFVEVENSCNLYREEVDRLSVEVSELQVKAAKCHHLERKLRLQEDLVSQLRLKMELGEVEVEKSREALGRLQGNDRTVPSLLGEIANLETQLGQSQKKISRAEAKAELESENLAKAENQIDELTSRLSQMLEQFHTLSQEHLIARNQLETRSGIENQEELESNIKQLEENLMEVMHEASQFKELWQIASNQAKQLNCIIQSNSITLQIVASKNTPEDVALKILNLHSDDDGGEIGYEVPTQLKTVFMKLIDRSEFRDLIQAFEERSQDELLIGKMHKALQHAKALEMRNRSECINARNDANALQIKVMKLHQTIQGKEEKIINLEKEQRLKELALKSTIDSLRKRSSNLSSKEVAILQKTNSELLQTLMQEQEIAEKEKRGHKESLLIVRELREQIESYKRIEDTLNNFKEENLILAKIAEWNEKLQSKSLENARLEFQIEALEDKIEFLSKRCEKYKAEVIKFKEKENIQNISHDEENEHLTKTFFNELKRYKESQTERINSDEMAEVKDQGVIMESSVEKLWSSQQQELMRIKGENQQLKDVLKERNETMSLLQTEHENQISEKHRIAIDEREAILQTAREQIGNMREQLEMKNRLIQQYKEMVESLNSKHRASLMSAHEEIARLNEVLLNAQDMDMEQFQEAVHVINSSPTLPKGLVTQESVDEIMEDRALQMNVLIEENEHLQQLIAELREQILVKAGEVEELSENFRTIEKHSEETEIMTKRLRRDLGDKERKQKRLSKTILELKQQLLEVAKAHDSRPALPPSRDVVREDWESQMETQKTRSEKHVRSLKARIKKLLSDLDYEKAQSLDSVSAISSKNGELKSNLAKKEAHNNRLHENNVKLRQEKRKLQEKYSKLVKLHRNEVSKLKSEIQSQESMGARSESVHTSQRSISEPHTPPQKQRNDEAFARWTETKKLRRTIDNMKKKLDARKKECEQLKTRVMELETDIESLEKAKADAQKLCQQYREKSEKQFSIDEAYEIVKYNHQLNQAKEDVIKLQRIIYVEKESEIMNLKMQLEKVRNDKGAKPVVRELKTPGEKNRYVEQIIDAKEELEKKLEDSEKILIQANVKNLELQFEVDTHSTVQQSLRTRIELMEGTLSRLKEEDLKKRKEKLPKDQESMRKLILNLKELAGRQKGEIENIKRNRVSNAKHMAVVKENRSLKSKVKDFEKCPLNESDFEQLESEIADLKEENQRLININKQVRKNLTREIDAAAKRKRKVEELEKEKILLEDQIEDKDRECEQKIKEVEAELFRERKMLAMDRKASVRKKDLKLKEMKQLQKHNERLKEELKSLLALTENQKQQLLASEDLRTKQREKIDEILSHSSPLIKEVEILRQSDNVKKVEGLREENVALRAELSAFDSQFFDEIEDLKYREKQQRDLNMDLQEQLNAYKLQLHSV